VTATLASHASHKDHERHNRLQVDSEVAEEHPVQPIREVVPDPGRTRIRRTSAGI
jgi:hypothetical protein